MTQHVEPAPAANAALQRVVLVLAALTLALLIAGMVGAAIWLGLRGSDALGRTYALQVTFPDARGVAPGDNVTMTGVRIGAVEDVSVTGRTARVRLRIRSGVEIPRGSRFVAQPELLSQPSSVRVEASEATESIVANTSGLTGTPAPDVTEAFTRVSSLTETLARTAERSSNLMDEATKTTRDLRASINDPETRRDLQQTLTNVRETTAGTRALLADPNVTSDLKVTLRNTRQISETAKSLLSLLEKAAKAKK